MIILKNPVPFNQWSSSPSDWVKRLSLSSKSVSVVFPRSRECTQQIWKKIFIELAILGIWIMIEKLSVWTWRMCIHTPGCHIFYFITFISGSVTWWRRWCSGRRLRSGQTCRRFWTMCATLFPPPPCLPILYCAILAWKAAGRLVVINHCWVSLYRNLHDVIPSELTSSLLHFSDLCSRFLNEFLRFLYCGAREPSFAHLGHIQGKAHIGLF